MRHAVTLNKFTQDAQRYISIKNTNSTQGRLMLEDVAELSTPLFSFASADFRLAQDGVIDEELQLAYQLDAALTSVFVLCFAASVVFCFIPRMRQVGTSVQSARALLVLLAPMLLGADSGSTMSGVLTSLASEVAAEQAAVSSMANSSLCSGDKGTQRLSLQLASSSGKLEGEEGGNLDVYAGQPCASLLHRMGVPVHW